MSERKTEAIAAKRFLPIKAFLKEVDWPTSEASVRWLIFNQKTNGFSKVIRRSGRRILLSLSDFQVWLDEQQK